MSLFASIITWRRGGASAALVAAMLFGVSTPVAKLFVADMSPWLLAGLLYLGSGLGLSLADVGRQLLGRAGVLRVARGDVIWIAWAILLGGVCGPVLLMAGLARTPASTASLLLNLEGVFTTAIAWYVFREGFDRRIALGFVAITAGAGILGWAGGIRVEGVSGPALIAAACLAWALDNNCTRRVSHNDPLRLAAIKGLIAGSVNVAVATALGASLPSLSAMVASAILGFFGYGLSLVLFIVALGSLGAARTGAYFSTAPFAGSIVALLLLHEPVTLRFLIAFALMAIGVWLHLTEDHEHEHLHDQMVHAHWHLHDDHHAHAHDHGDPGGSPHAHAHTHPLVWHRHPHFPDTHHRHSH